MDNQSEECNETFAQVISYLDQQNVDEIKKKLQIKDYMLNLVKCSWNLVPKICSYFLKDKDEVNDTCQEILLKLIDYGNVKELLILLLEQLDGSVHDVKFLYLLKPLQQCLLALPVKRGASVSLTLETLYECISKLSVPDLDRIEDEERKLLDLNPDVQLVTHYINEILIFLQPFSCNVETPKVQKRDITLFLVKVLDYPLGHLDLINRIRDEPGTKSISRSRNIAEKVLYHLSCLEKDFSRVIEDMLHMNTRIYYHKAYSQNNEDNIENDKSSIDYAFKEPCPELGLGIFAFLTLSDSSFEVNKPKVFTVVYWLDLTFKLIKTLLNHSNTLIREQGVILLKELISNGQVINSDEFSWGNYKELISGVANVAISSQSKHLAQSALKVFTSLYHSCEPERKYKFLHYVFINQNHSGLIGYTITLMKNDIDFNLRRDVSQKQSFFMAPKLEGLFDLVFLLPEGEKTDILENLDIIMSALNLLRYLALRDAPQDDFTGIWSIRKRLETSFLNPLRLGIDMSKAHYNLDIDNLKTGKIMQSEEKIDLSVNGDFNTDGLSKEQKLNVLEMSMQRLDIVQSVLCRTEELLQQALKKQT